MGYDSALQRVSELRALAGVDPTGSTDATAAAPPGAFQAQLAQQQAVLLTSQGGTAASTGAASSAMGQFGLPVLTVADQYRMMGLPVPTAGLPGGFGLGSGVGQKMVALAQQEIGVGETSGNNESPRIREYRSATAGAQDTPGPWCAYFVSWLAKNAGAPIGAGGNGTGYVPTLEAWGKQENRFVEFGKGAPSAGDIVIFDWGRDGVADHTGIVERVDPNGTIHTIEGNASDVVKRRDYPGSTSSIKGYVRV
jgi:uncharacterized protein (TIGR02594 family)